MNPERRRQVEQLYHEVLKRAPGQRSAFLAHASDGDEKLRREVESLIAHGDSSPGGRASLPTEGAPRLAGTDLGPYRIEALLGTGGMGSVYKALDNRLGRLVAIKILSEQFSNRFEREARAIATLNHPHICTLFDVGPNYLVMELLEGDTLATRIKGGALPLNLALKLAIETADAVDCAHRARVVHRDIKPHNIMLTRAG